MNKIIIYSVLPRLWGNSNRRKLKVNGTIQENGCGKLSAFNDQALNYIRSLGCTHIWFVGLLEHATTTAFEGIVADPGQIVKGCAGSPYAIKDYYDIAPSLADDIAKRHEEFDALVERVHAHGLKMLMDFVPNHVARTYASDVAPQGVIDLGADDDSSVCFSPDNCFYYLSGQTLQMPNQGSYTEDPARATGNNCFLSHPSHSDWYETVKINYGVDYCGNGSLHDKSIPKSWLRMLEILRYWVGRGVDGFRCDMAEMVPEAFWSWLIPQLKQERKDLLFLAEIYQPHRYSSYLEAGFDYLYDKVGVYDTLRAIMRGELAASAFDHARDAVGAYQPSMCYFLENHDEQRVASDFFCGQAELGLPALAVAVLSGTNPFLLYFAQELGERGMDSEGFSGLDGRTTIFDYWRLDSLTRLGKLINEAKLTDQETSILSQYRQILNLSHTEPILSLGAYHGINYVQHSNYDAHRLLSFVRYNREGEFILVVANFAHELKRVDINLPQNLLDLISVRANIPMLSHDLLNGMKSVCTWTPLAPMSIMVEPTNVRIVHYKPLH